jgi:hypothetical protein
MTANELIDATLVLINLEYQPGTLVWIKLNRPDIWGKVIALEQEINEVTFEGDVGKLKKVLESYQELFNNTSGG